MVSGQVEQVPVLIVGAGPAGLTTAVTLARHGVESLLVERRPDLSGLPRATSVSTRSMELFRSWGLQDELRAGGVEIEWLLCVCETLSQVSAGVAVPMGQPTRDHSAVISPIGPACVPQDHLESVLLRHLRSRAEARVELGTDVVSVVGGHDGARATLRDVATGESRIVEARYLVAADGAHSTVRAALGIPMRGPDRLRELVTALFRAPLWRLLGERRYGIYVVMHPLAEGAFVPAGPDDRWQFNVQFEPGRQNLADFTEERLGSLIRLGAGVAGLQPRIERIGGFYFAAQMAERFRDGAVFLIGDAAHRVTPRGGTGMNTAIQDGSDLGWKLAWVLRGWAEPRLLDSYEAERRPVAAHNAARSADPNGTRRRADQELPVDLGGRITHVWLPGADGVSTIDLLGPGLTLLTGAVSGRWDTATAAMAGPLPVDLRQLDAITARALGIPSDGAFLVRPDGALAGMWMHDRDAATDLHTACRIVSSGTPDPMQTLVLRT